MNKKFLLKTMCFGPKWRSWERNFRWRMKWRSEEWRLRFYSKKLTFIHYTVYSRTGSNTLHLTSSLHLTAERCTSLIHAAPRCTACTSLLHHAAHHCTSHCAACTLHRPAPLHFWKGKRQKKFSGMTKKGCNSCGWNPVKIRSKFCFRKKPVKIRLITGF